MLKKKKSFYNGSKKGIRSNLFGLERAGGANNGESYCCNGKQTNPCANNGNPWCCNTANQCATPIFTGVAGGD